LAYEYAIPASFIIMVVFVLVMRGIGAIFSALPSSTAMSWIHEIVGMLYPIGFVFFFGFGSSLKSKGFFKGILCSLPVVILELFLLAIVAGNTVANEATIWKPWYLVLLGLVSMIGIGIREECVFRATIQNILARKYASSVKGVWLTAIVSSLIFGLVHMSNIFIGAEVVPVIVQSIGCVTGGLFFAALYLRCGNIWVPVLIHALLDLAGLFGTVFSYGSTVAAISSTSWSSLFGEIPYVIVAVFLLRPSKCKEILARLNPVADEA
jgi:membrane protease YdiL (CAAX protease family)